MVDVSTTSNVNFVSETTYYVAVRKSDETKLNLSVYNNSKMKRLSLMENDLIGVTA
ncbi:MAG: hypothetical protein ABJB85_07375 [Nitrososphaerota archaeon]